MVFEVALMGLALHLLIWDKLPNWGSWFTSLIAALPAPVGTLYEQWRCSYCAGFWIALALHGLTGIWTVSSLAEMPAYLGALGAPVAWFLDALATATLIFIGSKILAAISRSELKLRLVEEPAAEPRKQDQGLAAWQARRPSSAAVKEARRPTSGSPSRRPGAAFRRGGGRSD